jgi:hypothetical protein
VTKEEKQKMMIDGAVFVGWWVEESNVRIYSFNGSRFVDGANESVQSVEWGRMTLKTPPPKPEYSREFEIIPPDEMARLMVAGEVLELHSKDKIDYKHGRFYYENGENFNCWAVKSRVATKTEKRWQWLIKYKDGNCITTSAKYVSSEEVYKNINKDWVVLRKIEESAEEFEIGAE